MPSRQDVADAVSYLASRAVQILTDVQGTNGDYQLAMSAATARKGVLALAGSLEEAPHATQSSVSGTSSAPPTG